MQLFYFWRRAIVHVKEVKVTIFESPQWLRMCQNSKPGPLTLGRAPGCLSWCVLSRSPTIRWTLKQALGQNVWSMCLDLHHVWPASTEGHANTRQTITRNKYRQAPSFRHVTWICMLTAVRNFLLLTPTPPHPHIHLSNMTPLPTRRRPGSQPSSRKPDCPHLLCERNELSFWNAPAAVLLTDRKAFCLVLIFPLLSSQRWRPNHGPRPWYVGVPAVSVAARQAASSLPLFPFLHNVWLHKDGSPSDVVPPPPIWLAALFPRPRRLEVQSRREGPQIVVDHFHVNTECRPGSGFNIEGVRCTEVPLCVHIWACTGKCIWLCVSMCMHACVFSCMCMAWSSTSTLYSCQIAANVLIQKHSVISNYI